MPADICRWEKWLPEKGTVHDRCVQWLLDKEIQKEASINVSGDDRQLITAFASAKRVVGYIEKLLEEYLFIEYCPSRSLLDALATVAGELF